MMDVFYAAVPLLTASLISCFGLAFALRDAKSNEVPPTAPTPVQDEAESTQKNSETQAQDIEQQQMRAKTEAEKTIDKKAVAAIDMTRKAVQALAKSKYDEALTAIESAQAEINLLLGRNPSTAAIPVNVEAEVFDLAPSDPSSIMDVAKDVSRAVDDKNFPTARVLLHSLMSEVRIRIYSLPLATFPFALKEAKRLIEQKKEKEASAVLLTALQTLVLADNINPIPLLLAREKVSKAQNEQDQAKALAILEEARQQIQRSRDLGYAGRDPGYLALNDQIDDLEKRIKGGGALNGLYSRLKERLSSFLKEHSEQPHQPHEA